MTQFRWYNYQKNIKRTPTFWTKVALSIHKFAVYILRWLMLVSWVVGVLQQNLCWQIVAWIIGNQIQHFSISSINNSWVNSPTILLYFAHMIILDTWWSILILSKLIQSLNWIKINSPHFKVARYSFQKFRCLTLWHVQTTHF